MACSPPDTSSSGSILYVVSERKGRWSKPHPLVSVPVPIPSVQFNPKFGILAFTATVYNGNATLEGTTSIDRQEQEQADTARVYDNLWVRHWDTSISPKLPQIHTLKLVSTSDNSFKPKGQPRNIMKGTEADGRLEALGSFVVSPNGLQIAFVAKEPGKDYAWKTASFICLADVDGSAAAPINPGNGGASSNPSFNHDGTKIAHLQTTVPTYWADRNQIKIYYIAEKTTTNAASDWDRSPGQVKWDDDSTLLVTYNEYGRNKLSKTDIATRNVTPIVATHVVSPFKRFTGTDKLLINYSALDAPKDLVTNANQELGNSIELSVPENVGFVGADNATIHGFLLCPPQFDASKKHPLAFVIHGGPQPRWNLNIFAAAGFVTVALDPQGSTGYGKEFTDAVRNQWGGKPYNSLMMSLEQLLETHTYIGRNRIAVLGASYGGYMVNWINGHTDVFRALVSHDGIFSTIRTYYSTEELYLLEADFEGIPSDNKAHKNYKKWSPERFVQNWKTSTLVIHSEKDYRLVVSEGLSTFTALRRQSVPAKFLYFPDENHWALKPANPLCWHHEVLLWISKWTKNDETVESGALIKNIGAKPHVQKDIFD
ncbi:Dipeptidyl-peptidase 5 [Coemansia sp. RSA 1646]|nr:Dipeptidyl-peptidase 5 [Coemansia sp. RSA 1646]